jgi:hypothetical protein
MGDGGGPFSGRRGRRHQRLRTEKIERGHPGGGSTPGSSLQVYSCSGNVDMTIAAIARDRIDTLQWLYVFASAAGEGQAAAVG